MTTIICLTAAVTPRVAGPVAIRDPGERLRQYQSSVRWWAKWASVSDAVVRVLETTGCSRETFVAAVPENLRESIDFMPVAVPPSIEARGKGAAEFHAVAEMLTGRRHLADETIYKVTGRLTMPNASRVIRALPSGHVAVRMTIDRTYADTRVLGMSGASWTQMLSGAVDRMDDVRGIFAEHVIAGRLASLAAIRELRIDGFPVKPQLIGSSGSTGERYRLESRPVARIRSLVERSLRDIASRKQI